MEIQEILTLLSNPENILIVSHDDDGDYGLRLNGEYFGDSQDVSLIELEESGKVKFVEWSKGWHSERIILKDE